VRGHLDDVMAKLPADQRDAAAAAFRFLVTSNGRKIALSAGELREFSDTAAAPLEPALEHLERDRILRPIPSSEPGGVARREVYHDVLAPAILDWGRRHAEERRRAETERRLVQAREQARRLEVLTHRLAAAVLALTAVAVALALYVLNPEPVQRLELRTVDARFLLRGTRVPDPRIVLVAVDDRTVAHLNPQGTLPPIPRQSYAQILNQLRRDRPDVIALDVIFGGAVGRRGDRALLKAIRATHDRLVLTYEDFTIVTEPDGTQTVRAELFGRPEALEATGVRTAFATLPEDVDDGNRRVDYQVNTSAGVGGETLTFAAADVARNGALRSQDLPTAPRRAVGEQSERTTWINYRGPSGTVRRVSALDVLNGQVAPGTFSDKHVVVGVTAAVTPDVHDTPFDRMRGPEVQANALDTILRGAPLRDVPPLLDVLAILLIGAVPALAALALRRYIAVATFVAGAVLFLAYAQIAFSAGWIVAVVVPLAGLLAAALGAAGLAAAGALRRRRTFE
jgi:adenylate cyclase